MKTTFIYLIALTRYVKCRLSSPWLTKSSRPSPVGRGRVIFIPSGTMIYAKEFEIPLPVVHCHHSSFPQRKNGKTCRIECRSQTQGTQTVKIIALTQSLLTPIRIIDATIAGQTYTYESLTPRTTLCLLHWQKYSTKSDYSVQPTSPPPSVDQVMRKE